LGTRSVSDNPDIGVIILRRLSNPAATTVSLSVLQAPAKARKCYKEANAELAKENRNFEKITKELQEAVRRYPKFSAAWDLLARVQMSQGDRAEARQSFLRSIETESTFLQPHMGLAQMAVQAGDWTETANWTRKALELDADLARALYWNGLANFYLEEYAQGEDSLVRLYDQGYAATFPFGLLPLGVIHASRGAIQAAAREFQLYLRHMPAEKVPEHQRAELEKQLSLWEEQGLVQLAEDIESSLESP
jgi:hypothetical protein